MEIMRGYISNGRVRADPLINSKYSSAISLWLIKCHSGLTYTKYSKAIAA